MPKTAENQIGNREPQGADRWFPPTPNVLSLNLVKIAAMSGLLIFIFFCLLIYKIETLELNPLYAKDHKLSVLPFARLEGMAAFVSSLSIFIYLGCLAYMEGLILKKAALKLPFGVGIIAICFLIIYVLMSSTSIFYGVFAFDPDFIRSSNEPWLDVELCLKFVSRVTLALTIVLLPVEAVVVYLVRRGKKHG